MSGIDTAALIDALITIDRRPIDLLEDRRSDLTDQRGKFRELNTKLLALRDAARGLDNRSDSLNGDAFEEELIGFQVEASEDARVTATGSGLASPGTYDVEVEKLATIGREITKSFASNTDAIFAEGETLTLSFNDPERDDLVITAGVGGASLQDLRGAINGDASNEDFVRAEILFDGTEYRLILSAAEEGVDNGFTVSGTGANLGAADFLDAELDTPAEDAIVHILGVAVSSATNTVEDALPGITLNLLSAHEPDPDNVGEFLDGDTLTVSVDTEEVTSRVQGFLDAYNEINTLIQAQFQVDEQGEGAGPLNNSPLLRNIQVRLQRLITNRFPQALPSESAFTPFSALSEVGIRTGSNGALELDTEDFEDALNRSPSGIAQLFGGDRSLDDVGNEGDGVATAIARELEAVVRFGDGILSLQEQGLTRQLDNLGAQILRFEDRLEVRRDRLILQFTRLEESISALQSQQSFLGAIR